MKLFIYYRVHSYFILVLCAVIMSSGRTKRSGRINRTNGYGSRSQNKPKKNKYYFPTWGMFIVICDGKEYVTEGIDYVDGWSAMKFTIDGTDHNVKINNQHEYYVTGYNVTNLELSSFCLVDGELTQCDTRYLTIQKK